MAYIYFKCSCGKSLAVDESGVGRTIECVDCGAQVTIPEWEYEFVCPGCGATFGATPNVVNDLVQCVDCGNKFAVPESNAPAQSDRESVPADEPADAPVNEVQRPDVHDEPVASSPPAVPSREGIDWSRLSVMLYRLTVAVVVIFIVVTGASWFVVQVIQSNANLDLAAQHSQTQKDLSSANVILENAIKQYPLALTRARQAKMLLAKNQASLQDSSNLVVVIALTKADKDGSRAVNMLAKAIRKYPGATNLAEAEELVKSIQAQHNDTWTLAIALRNAQMTEDPASRIEFLEKALEACASATNRVDAEEMLAASRRQLRENKDLREAMEQARQAADPSTGVSLLTEALNRCPQAGNRDEAQNLLNSMQNNASGEVKDPLLKAISSAGEQQNAAAAVQLLKAALEKNEGSPYRAEAEQVLAVYRKQLLEETAAQRTALTNYLEGAGEALATEGYVFMSPDKPMVGAAKPLALYDSELVNKTVAVNYGVEVWLQKVIGLNDSGDHGSAPQVNKSRGCSRYIPRLVLSARNAAIAKGAVVVVEYYVADLLDKSAIQKDVVERIKFPAMAQGKTLAVDARGIDLRQPGKGNVPKKDAPKKDTGERLHGIIVSLFDSDGKLLLQKCSTAKLIKECSPREAY